MGLKKKNKNKSERLSRPGGSNRRYTVLDIVKTDNTFEIAVRNNESYWVGRCLFCKSRLVVNIDGTTSATIEHIQALSHEGTNDLENLAIACKSCNDEKGHRHDSGKKPVDLINQLLEIRRQRWRDLSASC